METATTSKVVVKDEDSGEYFPTILIFATRALAQAKAAYVAGFTDSLVVEEAPGVFVVLV